MALRVKPRPSAPGADQALIDAFIQSHGVTACPAAMAAPTETTLPSADIAVLKQRGDVVGDAWRAKHVHWKRRKRLSAHEDN
jgi:hypothetical protein